MHALKKSLSLLQLIENEKVMKRWTGLVIPVVLILLLTSFGKLPFFKKNVEVPSFLLQELNADKFFGFAGRRAQFCRF